MKRILVIATVVVASLATNSHISASPSDSSEVSSSDDEDDLTVTLTILGDFTWYDPALCDEYPINCQGDPNNTAGGYHVPDWYGRGAACPSQLPIGQEFYAEGYGSYTCIDRGGSVTLSEDGLFKFDILHDSTYDPPARRTAPVTLTLDKSTIKKIMMVAPNPFVEPEIEFGCPATTCDEIFYTHNLRVTNPYTHETYTHVGTDYYTGDSGVGKVFAAAGGFVLSSDILDRPGNRCGGRIVIDHGYGWKTVYCHLTDRTVQEGDYVRIGDEIGNAGWSGYTLEGQHVHIELEHYEVNLNFQYYLGKSDTYIALTEPKLEAEIASLDLTMWEATEAPVKLETEDEVMTIPSESAKDSYEVETEMVAEVETMAIIQKESEEYHKSNEIEEKTTLLETVAEPNITKEIVTVMEESMIDTTDKSIGILPITIAIAADDKEAG